MKQFIKTLSIVMLSTAMLVSCGKENENPSGDPSQDSTEESFKVTFNGQEYTNFPYKCAKIVEMDGVQCLWVEGHPEDISNPSQVTSEDQACPGFRIVLKGTTTGTYESTDIDNETLYLNGDVKHYEFYSAGALYKDNVFYGDWWGLNAKVTLTKCDRSKGLVSFTATGNMFCSGQAILQGMGVDASSKGTMTMTIENIPLVQ